MSHPFHSQKVVSANQAEMDGCDCLALDACISFLYTVLMAQVILDLPEVLFTFLTASGNNLESAALQAIALEAYREGKLSMSQLRRLLGYRTRTQVHAFLKEHGVYVRYSLADLQHDRKAGDALPVPPTA